MTVADENGTLFEGATVTGTFSGPIDETGSDITDRRGRTVIVSVNTFANKEFRSLDFCVDDIVAAGYSYDPSANGDPSWDCGTSASSGNLASGPGQLDAQEVPNSPVLEQNYPNPFNPTTMVTFALPESGHVSVRVFNLLGQEVATLVNEVRDAGQHNVSFDATNLSAGVYLYVMESASFTITKRMTLLK